MVRRSDGAPADSHAYLDPFVESILEIEPRWQEGLVGLEEYSHLVVIFYLDRAKRRRSVGLADGAEGRAGLAKVGFFATRTPRRPNPIGLACPRLLRRDGLRLHVRGIDAWDGTPILDLKGYSPRDELHPAATVPEWLTELWRQHDREQATPDRTS